MKSLPLAFLLALTACGSAKLIRTFEVEDGGPDASTSKVDGGRPVTEGPDGDAGFIDAGTEPDGGTERDAGPVDGLCSVDGWCRDALNADGGPLTSKHLRAVFARTPDEAYVVGDNGTLLLWNGVSWRAAPSGGPADDLFAVWASGPTDVWVAGISGDPYAPAGVYAHFDGTRFDGFYKPLSRRAGALFGHAKNDVWSVGAEGELWRWNGTSITWQSAAAVSQAELSDVVGLNGKLWAVGSVGTVLHHDGQSWSVMGPPVGGSSGGLAAIVAFAPNRLVAAGGNDWLEFDGVQWTHSRFPVAQAVELLGLWGASPQRLWGVGPSGQAWRFEAGQAHSSQTGVTALLRDVHGVDEQHIWAVGFNGTVLRRRGP